MGLLAAPKLLVIARVAEISFQGALADLSSDKERSGIKQAHYVQKNASPILLD